MKLKLTLVFSIVLIILSGCSNTGNPTVSPLIDTTMDNLTIPVLVENNPASDFTSAGAGMMGIFDVHIDTLNLTGSLTQTRKISIDDALEMVDLTNYLRLAPCTDCAKLMSIELDADNNVVLKIGLKHPFDAGDPLKPISGLNRADLHVFNVEGTVIFDDATGTNSFMGLGEVSALRKLLNADGLSGYLDTALDEIYPTTATVHPYILHFDDYSTGNFDPASPTGFTSVTDPPPSGNLVMAMGCDYDVQDYVFNPGSGGTLNFKLAFGCTYAISSASKSMRFTPEYQIPQHNKKAASEIWLEIINNELKDGDTLSTAEMKIFIVDINHQVSTGNNRDEMLADSSVDDIIIDIPSVTSIPVILDGNSPDPGSGTGHSPADPAFYTATITNAGAASEGIYPGLVKVTDKYPTGNNESPLLNGMDALKRVAPGINPLTGLYSLTEFATYMLFEIEVLSGSGAPVASFTTEPAGDPNLSIYYLDDVTFTSTSTDPDDPLTPEGQIVSYEWDFEWDGDPLTFTDDTFGLGTDIETHQFDIPGTHYTGLRVTDAGTPPLTSDIFSIQVGVDNWSQEITVDSNNGRIPKIGAMPSGKMMLIWSGVDNQNHYSIYDTSWSTPQVMSVNTTDYLSLSTGPGDNEAWAGGGVKWFRYNDSSGLWQISVGEIGHGIQTHIYAVNTGGYKVFHNTSSAFGHIIRSYWDDINTYNPIFTYEYIWLYGGNNRLLGESRIIDTNSSEKLFLVYKQDMAIDPYQSPQDLRRIKIASMYPTIQGRVVRVIEQGANDVLDSVVIAVDSNDKLHIAYRNQPDGGGDYSVHYRSSIDDGTSWSGTSTVWTGAAEPEYEYISIDTDSSNRIIVTYRTGDNISWVYSSDGSSWSTPEVVNVNYPGGATNDKEQFMVVDSDGETHVVWDRCAAGAVGHGPIIHRVRAPLN